MWRIIRFLYIEYNYLLSLIIFGVLYCLYYFFTAFFGFFASFFCELFPFAIHFKLIIVDNNVSISCFNKQRKTAPEIQVLFNFYKFKIIAAISGNTTV